MDTVDPERRSRIMARVRSKDTAPELAVRRLLHGLGYSYRLHGKRLPGRPDLVFTGRKAVIFVHGCFWHRHNGCHRAFIPSSRVEFWKEKFTRNVARDAEVEGRLTSAGWKTMTVWECEIRAPDLPRKLQAFLGPPGGGSKR